MLKTSKMFLLQKSEHKHFYHLIYSFSTSVQILGEIIEAFTHCLPGFFWQSKASIFFSFLCFFLQPLLYFLCQCHLFTGKFVVAKLKTFFIKSKVNFLTSKFGNNFSKLVFVVCTASYWALHHLWERLLICHLQSTTFFIDKMKLLRMNKTCP